MGMSASQARFLSLTARKNNVEFEGQQINQQRTTLSNESASYYSELCNMTVPTPPSIDDYTKVSYTFNDGAMTNTLVSLLPTGNGTNSYVVNYIEEWQDDYAIVPSSSSLVERTETPDGDYAYSIGSQSLRKIGDIEETQIPTGKYTYKGKTLTTNEDIYTLDEDDIQSNGNEIAATVYTDADGNEYYMHTTEDKQQVWYMMNEENDKEAKLIDGKLPQAQVETKYSTTDDEYFNSLDDTQKDALLKNEQYLLKMVQEKTGSDGEFYIRYIQNSVNGNYEPYMYSANELKDGAKYNDKNLAAIPCYALGSTTKTKEILHKEATVEKDSSGRYVAITINVGTDDNGKAINRTYQLTTTTTTDEAAYNDAMNQYNYKQHEYDHQIQETNSKLEIIQQQDKQLELKLKQLDTEENAINTEIDAVKKVISKNIENSFKTFSA